MDLRDEDKRGVTMRREAIRKSFKIWDLLSLWVDVMVSARASADFGEDRSNGG